MKQKEKEIINFEINNFHEYLKKFEISIEDDYFNNLLSLNNNNKINNYINDNPSDKNKLIEITDVNYHLFFIHLFNQDLNNILKLINEFYEKNIDEKRKDIFNLEKIKLKKELYNNKFNLEYKVFFNEQYPIDLIPAYKLKQFYIDNPKLKIY